MNPRTSRWLRRLLMAAVMGLGLIFAIISLGLTHAVLLRPLGVQEADQLVRLGETNEERTFLNSLAWPDAETFAQASVFSGVVGEAYGENIHWPVGDQRVLAAPRLVTGNYFGVLGVNPALGRLLSDRDNAPEGPVPVVLSYAFWSRAYRSDPSAVGQQLSTGKHHLVIVGVASPEFRGFGLDSVDLWMPAQRLLPIKTWSDPRDQRFEVVARLAAGTSRQQADAMVHAMATSQTRHGPQWRAMAVTVDRLGNSFREERPVWTAKLLAGGGLASLLLTLVNVAALLALWFNRNGPSLVIRRWLGASSWHIGRLLAIEAVWVSTIATGLAMVTTSATALLTQRGVMRFPTLDFPPWSDVLPLCIWVCLISSVVFIGSSLLLSLVAGISPTGASTRHATRRRRVFNTVTVSLQVAIGMALVTGAYMLGERAQDERDVSPGFDPTALATLALQFDERPKLVQEARYRRILQQAEAKFGASSSAIAGVEPVATSTMSTSGWTSSSDSVRGVFNPISNTFFDVVGIRLLAGRNFSTNDGSTAPRVVILSEAAAAALFGVASPLDKQITLGVDDKTPVTVIGVASNVSYEQIAGSAEAAYYVPFEQRAWAGPAYLLVSSKRTHLKSSVTSHMERLVAELEPSFAIPTARFVEERIVELLTPLRRAGTAAGFFGVAALALAAIGMFTTTSAAVHAQRKEFAIRSVFGEAPKGAFLRVVRASLLFAIFGVAGGLVLSSITASAVRASFPQVPTTSLSQIALPLVVVLVVIALATMGPAFSMSRTRIAEVLRDE